MNYDGCTCSAYICARLLLGLKHAENRWQPALHDAGRLAITMSKRTTKAEFGRIVEYLVGNGIDEARSLDWNTFKTLRGKVFAIADYRQSVSDKLTEDEKSLVKDDYEGYDNWWIFDRIEYLKDPIPCNGSTGMWKVPEEVSKAIDDQVNSTNNQQI